MSSLFTPNSIACLTLLSVIFLVFIDIKSVPKEDLLTSLSLSSFKSPLTSVEDISYAISISPFSGIVINIRFLILGSPMKNLSKASNSTFSPIPHFFIL